MSIAADPGSSEARARQDRSRRTRSGSLRGIAVTAALALLVELGLALLIAGAARNRHGVPWLAVTAAALVCAAVAAAAAALRPGLDTRRLRRIQRAVSAAAEGRLAVSVGSARNDSLGELERDVDALIGRFRELTASLEQGTEVFHDGRTALAAMNKHLLSSAETTAGHAYDVGVAAERVSESIQIVAVSTEELSATINEVARHAQVAADIAVDAATEAEQAQGGVRELGSSLRQVEEIAAVISKITAQTHLLALNATIEAARAGEAGRGFAVVAAEVKELARETAEATDKVRDIVVGIHEGSGRAAEAIGRITHTMSLICDNTSSIASAVTEQTATTREIGRVSVIAAEGARDISTRTSIVHDRAREVAYLSAQNGATRSKEFELLEAAFRKATAGLDAGGLLVDLQLHEEVTEADQEQLNREGTVTRDGTTTVQDYVLGEGLLQFHYTGSWLHGTGYETDPTGDAYSCVTGDEVTLRFTGSRMSLWGYLGPQQGCAEVWIDDAEPVLADWYGEGRALRPVWESAQLSHGEHTLHLRVAGKKHPDAHYFWISLAYVEIQH